MSEVYRATRRRAGLRSRTASPRYVSMKGYAKIAIEILVKNATTVTGSAITLKQAKTTGGASEKALAFSTIYENLDTENSSTGDTLTEAAVSSSTFTTNTTN